MIKKIILSIAAMALAICGTIAVTENRVYADGDVETTILDCQDNGHGECIYWLLNVVLTILTYGVGIAGVLGIAISGVQYLTARDNEAQVQKAKSRILQVIIGLAAYAVLWTALNWLIPGGLFNSGP